MLNVSVVGCLTWFLPLCADAQSVDRSWKKDASIVYSGVCDGSAAIRIDVRTLLVANDETNFLHTFDILGGASVASFDLEEALQLDPKNSEIDLEAVAKLGNRIWWVGSHGRNKNGKNRPNRKLFFSTNVPLRDLTDIQVTSSQDNLIAILQAHPDLAKILTKDVVKTAPKRGGLNIEGMAFAPDGRLILGFRSPLTKSNGMKGDALIVYLSEDDGVWSVSSFVRLDLQNRGIRDIVWADGQWVLIAGPVSSGGAFDIYTWSGEGTEAQHLKTPGFEGLNPEALVPIDSKWLVLSDDGGQGRVSANGTQRECKTLAEHQDMKNVYFRARLLSDR